MKTKRQIDEFTIRYTEHIHGFQWDEPYSGGFGFPCDEKGFIEVDELQPPGLESLAMCQAGEGMLRGKMVKIIDTGVESWDNDVRLCQCGSGEPDDWMYDGHNIPLCLVCSKCKEEKIKRYNPWVFGSYTEEQCGCPIEPEEEVG